MRAEINIAAIVPYKIFPAKMGGQKGIACFYGYLSRLQPVALLVSSDNQLSPQSHGDVYPLLGRSRLRYINIGLFFKLRQFIRRNHITHLIIEHPYYGWLGTLLKKNCGVVLILHSHNIEGLRFKSTGKRWWRILLGYERWAHRCADMSFFVTEEDKNIAITRFDLKPSLCDVITYGFERNAAPHPTERREAKRILQDLYNISPGEKIVLFNGTLDYGPNLTAVDCILAEINPRLMKTGSFNYKIIICGKNLPESYQELNDYTSQNIIYAGFVDDIAVYFKGADYFINPVMDGGGIKTKLVEALGYNITCISTTSGATGIDPDLTGGKLKVITDGRWDDFANAMVNMDTTLDISQEFFTRFYWGNIARKAANVLEAQKHTGRK